MLFRPAMSRAVDVARMRFLFRQRLDGHVQFMPLPTVDIRTVASRVECRQARELFEEYAASLDISLCFQNFASELAGLPGDYAPPCGRLLLLRVGREWAGCVALRPKGPAVGEIKRLYLRPKFHGRGLGRLLAERIIREARTIGYTTLHLDTLPGMMAAQRLYTRLGFVPRTPDYASPVAGHVFMELKLA
jgi:GNAT superfamily N-acetyltransferase